MRKIEFHPVGGYSDSAQQRLSVKACSFRHILAKTRSSFEYDLLYGVFHRIHKQVVETRDDFITLAGLNSYDCHRLLRRRVFVFDRIGIYSHAITTPKHCVGSSKGEVVCRGDTSSTKNHKLFFTRPLARI